MLYDGQYDDEAGQDQQDTHVDEAAADDKKTGVARCQDETQERTRRQGEGNRSQTFARVMCPDEPEPDGNRDQHSDEWLTDDRWPPAATRHDRIDRVRDFGRYVRGGAALCHGLVPGRWSGGACPLSTVTARSAWAARTST